MNTYNNNSNYDDTYQQNSQYHQQTSYHEQGGYDEEPYYYTPQPPEPKKKKKRFLFWLIFLVALCVLLYSGYQLFIIFKANWDEQRELDRVTEIGNIPENPEEPFTVNWDELRNINSDIIAWLLIPDTNISYPVVQGKDNDYYLTHTFGKEVNYAGAIFADYQTKGDFSETNTFLYGHNTRHGTMFGQLENFVDEAFFDAHKYVYLFTPDKNYKAEIVSFYSTKAGTKSYRIGITDPKEWQDYLDFIKSDGFVHEEVTLGESDRLITLSTCSYEINNELTDQRYLLHAKLVPWIGEYMQESDDTPQE